MLIILNLLLVLSAQAQNISHFSFISDSVSHHTMKFKVINNLILLPLSFNGSDTLYFILDSGAENITLFGAEFETPPVDTSQLRLVNVAGSGDELIRAFVSPINKMKIGQIIGKSVNIIYIPDDFIQFSDLLGHEVHGILGIQIFQSFVIKLDYFHREVTFIDIDYFKPKRRYSQLPVNLVSGRPFIDLEVEIHPKIKMETNLLVDLGESKPLSLFLSTNEAFILPYPNYYANLGKGLSGMITGRVARVKSVTIDKFVLNNVITAFPDQDAIQYLTSNSRRNGSLGAGILRRFVSVFDLPHKMIYLKRSGLLRQPFSYDNTGLIMVAEGVSFDEFRITGVIAGSAAEKSGLQQDDLVIAVNGEPTKGLKLGEVINLISIGGRKLHFDVQRNEELLEFSFKVFKVL